MTDDAGLGRVLVRHDKRNGWRLLLGALVAGGGVLSAVEAMTIAEGRVGRAVHWVLAAALGLYGGRMLWRALRAGTAEYVEAREHGLAHATAAGVRTWTWDRFGSVRVGHHTDTFVLRCAIRIRFADGSRLDLSLWGRRSHDVGRSIAAACRRRGRPVVERDLECGDEPPFRPDRPADIHDRMPVFLTTDALPDLARASASRVVRRWWRVAGVVAYRYLSDAQP